MIEKCDIVFLSGLMIMARFDGAECERFFRRCKEMGKVTVLDVAWNANGNWREVMGDCLRYVDYFLPSYDEACEICGMTDVSEISRELISMGAKSVVVKMGEEGCFVLEGADSVGYMVPALTGIDVVDTTGAGDAFCSGFLYGLSEGFAIKEAARFGCATGAVCVTAFGATSGMMSFDEIKIFMDERIG